MANLNYLEAFKWTDIPQLGCWMPLMELGADGKTTGVARLAHASFVPNLLYSDGIATNFAVWSVARARWVRKERWPKLEDKPMIEILNARYGSKAGVAD